MNLEMGEEGTCGSSTELDNAAANITAPRIDNVILDVHGMGLGEYCIDI